MRMLVSRYFYAETAPSAVDYENISLLNRLSINSLKNVAATCFSPQQSHEMLEALAQKEKLSPSQVCKAAKTLHCVLEGFISKNLSSEQMMSDLSQLGLEQSRREAIVSCCHSSEPQRKSDELLLGEKVDLTRLVDLEWKFGVTAASSELDRVGATFLQLKLKVANNNCEMENIHMELTLSQFYNFLHELEKAKAAMESIP